VPKAKEAALKPDSERFASALEVARTARLNFSYRLPGGTDFYYLLPSEA